MSDYTRIFGENIYHLRANNKYTQQQVAEAMGISHATVANYEQGKSSPTMDTAKMFAELYGVEMNDLMVEGRFPLTVLESMRGKGKNYSRSLTMDEKRLIRALRAKDWPAATRLIAKAMKDA